MVLSGGGGGAGGAAMSAGWVGGGRKAWETWGIGIGCLCTATGLPLVWLPLFCFSLTYKLYWI